MVSNLSFSAPTGEWPITEDRAKLWLVDVITEDEVLVPDLIASSGEDVERCCKLILRKGVAFVYAAAWPSCIVLEHRPINAVTKIEYYAEDENTLTLLDNTDDVAYEVVVEGMLTYIHFKEGVSENALNTDKVRPIVVTLNVGYNDAVEAENAPAWVGRVMLGLCALYYEFRNGAPEKLVEAVDKYLWRHAPPAI